MKNNLGAIVFKITIIIPVSYHQELSIETFESILNQTIGFESLQIIVVYQKFNQYLIDLSEKYENFILIKINDSDVFNGQLYNVGLKHASSDFLMFLKPQEILVENACELLYGEIFDESIDFISGVSDVGGKSYHEDKWELLINNFNIGDKLFNRLFIINNGFKFSEDSLGSELPFLVNIFMNSENFRILNKILLTSNTTKHKFSKKDIKGLLNKYYEIFYITQNHEKSSIFNNKQLLDNLNHFLTLCLVNDFSVNDLLELLIYSKPLFNLYYQNTDFKFADKSPLFDYIYQGKYEDALYYVFGENTPKQKDIVVAALCDYYTYDSFKFECDFIKLNQNWLNQLKTKKPDLFLFTPSNNENIDLNEIINYCNNQNIPTIIWENKETDLSKEIFLSFDYIFSSYEKNVQYYKNKKHKNVNFLMPATQPILFNPLNKYRKLTDKNPKDKKISTTIERFIREFDSYERTTLMAPGCPIQYNHVSNLEKMDGIIEELKEYPLLSNENSCDHKIFELMSLNKLVFSDYSNILDELFGNNIYYFSKDNIDFTKTGIDEIKNKNLHNVLKNHTYTNRLQQILDTINFKYVPYLKHITLFYELNEITELDAIYNHFHSIEYPYKQMILITTEDKLYLPNAILKSQLSNLKFFEKDYFVFADLNLNSF